MRHGDLTAVLFDMDGTLLDTEKIWEAGLRDLCARLGHRLDPSLRSALVGMDQTRSIRLLHSRLGLPQDTVPDSVAWLVDRMAELFAAGVVWRPGARELVRDVRRAGLRTALVTATGRRLVDVVVGTLGRDAFDATVVGDEVARNKPDPLPYRTAMESLEVTTSACLAIEDSPTGVASARDAGCAVLAVPSEVPIHADERVTVVESLIEVDVETLRRTCAALNAAR